MDDLDKKSNSSILCQALCIISNPLVNSKWSYSPDTLNLVRNWQYFVLCELEIRWVTLQNNWAPLLYYTKHCASFQIHWCCQTWVTVRKCSIRVKIGDFFVPRDLEIRWMTLKNNTAPLLYYIKLCASFQTIGEFKLELQSGNAQFR